MDYGRGAGVVASAATTVAATNSSYIYNSLPSTGIKSFYSILGDFTILAIVAMTVIAISYKIAIAIRSKA
jgi:hypothetical protein